MRLPRFVVRLWLLLLLLFMTTACPPEFQDSTCTADTDCFGDEQCSEAGVCEAKPPSPGVIDSFLAGASSVEEGQGTTLSWVITGAASASISGSNDFAYTIPRSDLEQGSTPVMNLIQDTTFTLSVVG